MATYKRQTKCCSTCLKTLQKNQKILNCTLCSTFHHFNCVNLNKNLYSQFYKNWFCNLCADSTFPFQTVSDSELEKLFSFDHDFPNLNPTYLNDAFKNADDNNDELNINDTYIDTNEAKVILRQNRTKQFSSPYVNARSLVNPTNFAKFQCLVASLNFEPDVIAVNETLEKPGSTGQYKSLQGYHYVSNARSISKGGGVAMYVKKNISYQLCCDLTIMNEKYFESLFILLKVECCEVVCGTIYRSPNHSSNAFDEFANNLSTTLALLKKRNSINYVMGDLNFNLLNSNDKLTENFVDMMLDHGYYPLINKPTRITT